jgi:DNA-binding IscR family transcriptional regulator
MSINELLAKLNSTPSDIQFTEVIAVIDENFTFTPTEFKNGDLKNEAGQNSGSCKLFSFARLFNLSKEQTLQCFGDYYRVDVLQHPEQTDHQNIRNFIKFGWDGIVFESSALSPK